VVVVVVLAVELAAAAVLVALASPPPGRCRRVRPRSVVEGLSPPPPRVRKNRLPGLRASVLNNGRRRRPPVADNESLVVEEVEVEVDVVSSVKKIKVNI
jgi:hypothetical protein